MTELVVCRSPGDELAEFGNVLLSRPPGEVEVVAATAHPLQPAHADGEAILQSAARAAGARQARLLPFAHLPQDPIHPGLIAEALGPLDHYQRVYTHSVQDPRPLCARIAAAVGARAQEVWTPAGGGAVDEVLRCPKTAFERRLALLSEHYADLLEEGRIEPWRLRDTDLFQRHPGVNLHRYFRICVDWHMGEFASGQPWDLETSAYEQRRHEAELAVLYLFPWECLVEVAACEGAFTERLCNAFPSRQVIACEPDPFFFASLERRLAGRADLRRIDAEAAGEIPCDVLFMSSAIYYLWKMPYPMLRNARHVVVSHAARYHRGQLDNVLLSQGFELMHRATVPACVEPMEGILDVKYGTEIKVWRRR